MKRNQRVETFRTRLEKLIEDSGLSKSGFASRVGMDRSTLSQVLSASNDRLPRIETVAAIAEASGASLDWLLGLTEQERREADVVAQKSEIAPQAGMPWDERLVAWHREATGFKVRHIPANLPDMLKTADVIHYEYALFEESRPSQTRHVTDAGLAMQRMPETDMEMCNSFQSLVLFADGAGIWSGLKRDQRSAQLRHMANLTDELYPAFRWYLFDGRRNYACPFTVFGQQRVALYVGEMYLVYETREHLLAFNRLFDRLIRHAVVQPGDTSAYPASLADSVDTGDVIAAASLAREG